MSRLGDFFDPSSKLQLVSEHLHVGTVVRIHVTTTNPPKIKRLVIIGETADNRAFGTFFFNTDINWNVFRTPELQSHQYLLHSEDYDRVADHDCYIDCSKIEEVSRQYMVQELIEKPKNVLGQLTETDLLAIIEIVKNSTLFSPKQLKRYGLI